MDWIILAAIIVLFLAQGMIWNELKYAALDRKRADYKRRKGNMDEIIIVIEEECHEHHPHHHTPKLDRIESKVNKILALLRPHPQASRRIEFTNPLVTTNPEGTKETRIMAINVTPNDTIDQAVTVKDSDGDVLGASATFSTSDPAVLAVVDNGNNSYTATAVALGDAQVLVSVGGLDAPLSLGIDVHVQTGPAVAITAGEPTITAHDAPVV